MASPFFISLNLPIFTPSNTSNKMKRIVKTLTLMMTLAIIALVAGAFYMLSVALRPDFAEDNTEEASYAYMQREYPHIGAWMDQMHQSGAMRDTTLVGQDGEVLHARYVAAREKTAKTAVIVHGYTDNSIRMLMIGYMYHNDLGFNILLPDLHHHGHSGGRAVRMGWKDRLDVLRWMDVANEVFGGATEMVVHGISMGAATTMMVSGEEQQPYVKCFVEDCGYTSVWDQFAKELKEDYGLPAFPLLHVASRLCAWRYGWNFREASALEQVRKCRLPMLFIHGDADDYVPTWMVYPLYEAKAGDKELWVVSGAAHAKSYRDNREEYTERVRRFVGRYIR